MGPVNKEYITPEERRAKASTFRKLGRLFAGKGLTKIARQMEDDAAYLEEMRSGGTSTASNPYGEASAA